MKITKNGTFEIRIEEEITTINNNIYCVIVFIDPDNKTINISGSYPAIPIGELHKLKACIQMAEYILEYGIKFNKVNA